MAIYWHIFLCQHCSKHDLFLYKFTLFETSRYTPLVTSACYSIGLLYTLHLIGILACWYGITKELSSWIVPKIVLKSTTVVVSIAITCILTYFITNDPRYIGELIARGLNADYAEHKSAIDIGTTVLVTVSAALAMGQTWLLVLLVGCYKDTREKELERMLEKAMRKEKTKEAKRRKERGEGNGKDGLYTTFI
ncbi:hypothetical protein Y032_0069g316 [Ancylostoma ceylanicum]|uniref:Uncharacterized protein n=1 Tax=Ancylostoma ceylanicum TaxID=53326 RepID=A0A016TXT3_9BILA|nr:hypothetical protein Y032_0069g316 [Ancylostoma ceylanicum]